MNVRHRLAAGALALLGTALACVDLSWADDSEHLLAADQPAGALAAASEPTGTITLREALSAVLARSQELASFAWSYRAKDAEVLQASKRPNPELSINPENFAGSGAFGGRSQYQNTLQLSQLLELGGKRGRRTEAAERGRDSARAEYEARRAEVLGGTTVDFVSVVSNQEAVKVARAARANAGDQLRAVRKRVAAGVGSRLEEVRATAAVERARVAEHHAEHQLAAARQSLAARWGSKAALFATAAGELFTSRELPAFDAVVERLESAPDRRVSVAAQKLRAAELTLARTKQVPDVSIGLGWRQGRDLDDQAVVAALTVPLQVFNRYEGDVAAAEALISKAAADVAAVDTRLRAAVFGLYQELAHARDEMTAMQQVIVPRSEEALMLARKGFEAGLHTQLELLDAQRTLTEVRLEHLKAATTFHQLTAELERLLGDSFGGFSE